MKSALLYTRALVLPITGSGLLKKKKKCQFPKTKTFLGDSVYNPSIPWVLLITGSQLFKKKKDDLSKFPNSKTFLGDSLSIKKYV